MVSIPQVLDRFKRDPLGVVDAARVEEICRAHGHAWRRRELDPATTVALFVQQVLAGNCPCAEVPHVGGRHFTASAYCQARARLPLAVYEELERWAVGRLLPRTRLRPWLGRHRTLLIDGTTAGMPDADGLNAHYGTASGHKPGCSFPLAHLLVLFDAGTGLLLGQVDSPFNTADMTVAAAVHGRVEAGDVLVGDEVFGTWAHLALLQRLGAHGLFPVHHGRVVDFTPRRPHRPEGRRHQKLSDREKKTPTSRWVRGLGHRDQVVEWFKPQQRPPWITREEYDALPGSITVRELRRTLRRRGRRPVTLTMVTTLLDPGDYPAAELRGLRLSRWDAETNIGHLKTQMGMWQLRCRSTDGVRKELAVFRLVYNLVRVVMLEAAGRQGVPVKRISFADALQWMRHARPGDQMPKLRLNPDRPDRLEPRRVKRRRKNYPYMVKPRAECREWLKQHENIRP
jgi:Transposase DDE domain